MDSAAKHSRLVRSGERFRFGDNWRDFLKSMTPARVERATSSFIAMSGLRDLTGMSFLDVGSGSGLSSLVALRLGAKVHSLDYDPVSVESTRAMRERFAPRASDWTIEEGDVLDPSYMRALGEFDYVYSWGVLHHTGDMWRAFENVVERVGPAGYFHVAIYNDLAATSDRWREVKRTYNQLPAPLQRPFALGVLMKTEAKAVARHALKLKLGEYIRMWTQASQKRGMSRWHDWIDWVGGYPYEVAKPEAVIEFCQARGMALSKLRTVAAGHGCNEFVCKRIEHATTARLSG